MTKQWKLYLVLMAILVLSSAGSLEASKSDTLLAPQNFSDAEYNTGESGVITEIDEWETLLTSVSQWLDTFLTSDASRNTSVISIWNH